jgi:oligopeptide/dipeptide ABC transporter ATP-binding protein
MVMYLGKPVETAREETCTRTEASVHRRAPLAVPIADPTARARRKQIVLEGDVPSPLNPPAACRFHPRCPRFVDGKCNVDEPMLGPAPVARPRVRVSLPARALADGRGRDPA